LNKIGEVKINYTFYSGHDQYSDGDIEEEILRIVKSTNDFADILKEDGRWPILYHLSPIRRNLLEWIELDKEGTALEIGAGCGALTGVLCEKTKRVVAVELSKRRAEIIAYRHRMCDNLEVVVGNFNDMEFVENFNYVTLIGVLEYAASFTNDEFPYGKFLKDIYKKIKVNGKLIIAIENRFGLKYWAGAREDHTGRLFDGLEGYPENPEVMTFGKKQLISLLEEAGFTSLNFYYPMPDYKLPLQVFSDNYLPDIGQINSFFPNYDMERLELFSEKLVFDGLIQNQQFDFFANSFLVICEKG
jgi:SAM-dependent methyltransferase